MKFFFLFAPFFHELPLALARQLSLERPGAAFAGLATGSRSIFERVSTSLDPIVAPLSWLDDLEREWLAVPSDAGRLAAYETRLGLDNVRRIITADRQIGDPLVVDAVTVRTPLKHLARDTEMVKRYVNGLLDWTFKTIDAEKPDLVFCYTVAGAPAYALSIVSRHLSIPFVRISSAHVDKKYTVDETVELSLGRVNELFVRALEDPSILAHALPAAREHLAQFRSRPAKYATSAQVHDRVARSHALPAIARQGYHDLRSALAGTVRQPARELRRPGPWRFGWNRATTSLRARRDRGSAHFRAPGDLPSRPFVYFPLQVNPEASTMVLAPMHTNQFAIVEALVKSLPLGTDLVTKEHIPMLGRRPRDFYRRLADLPGVVLASPFEDPFALITRAKLICTVSGTSAWEALRLNKPALTIGKPHYLAIGQGVTHCADLSRLPEVLPQAIDMPAVDETRVELYVAAIVDHCFDLPAELYRTGVTEAIVAKHADVIASLCDRILAMISDELSDRRVYE